MFGRRTLLGKFKHDARFIGDTLKPKGLTVILVYLVSTAT